MAKRTPPPPPPYPLPNMAAVANETRSYLDPKAGYPIARQAQDARAQGAARRR